MPKTPPEAKAGARTKQNKDLDKDPDPYKPDEGIFELKIKELKPMANGIKAHIVKLMDEYNDSSTTSMPKKRKEIEGLMCRLIDIDNAYRKFNGQSRVNYSMPKHSKKVRLISAYAQIEEQSATLSELIQQFTKLNTHQTEEKVDAMYIISKNLEKLYDLQAANARTKTVSYARTIPYQNRWQENI